MAGDDRLRELEEKYEGYKVYDNNGESIGKVDDLFVDDADREQYLGVKMGLFGLSGTTLIPLEIARVNEQDRVIEVAESKDRVKDAPHYGDDDEIDRSFEERIRSHFGLSSGPSSMGSYDRPTDATGAEGAAAGDNTVRGDDLGTSESGTRETVGREEYQNRDDYVSDSAMAAASGGATTSGGVSGFETGDREGKRQEHGERQGGAASAGGDVGSRDGEGSGDDRYREAYMEGYRQAIRDSAREGDTGPSGSMVTGGQQGGGSGEREGADDYSGAPSAGPGEQEAQDMQDYRSASTGYRPDRGGEGGQEGEGRTRVRRLRRGS